MKRTWTTIQIVWKKWLRVARVIGNFQLRIIFSVFYLIGFSILGVVFRFFKDPLEIKPALNKKSAFLPWAQPKGTLTLAQKPF